MFLDYVPGALPQARNGYRAFGAEHTYQKGTEMGENFY
jgi:hypothetical protein